MLTHSKILLKLEQILNQYKKLRFEPVLEIPVEMAETREHFRREPGPEARLKWRSIPRGERWGGSGITGWFRGDFAVPRELDGRKLFVNFRNAVEVLCLFDGDYKGVFNDRHPMVLALPKARAGKTHHIACEAYSGHSFPSTMPHDEPIVVADKSQLFDGIWVTTEREDVSAFCFDLEVLLKLMKVLDQNSLRRGTILRELETVWASVAALPFEVPESQWRPGLAVARRLMAPLLAAKNGPTTPSIALVAHSHIDTAWLWTIAETRRKCARTFSSMANLMDRYPEVIFLQSAPVHADFVRRDYPEIFAKVKALVKKGRWEPNGGCWVEPDCNLTGGESLVRQFLVGINWTREHYGYSSDTLWQPDVFGYAAALPQILQGCGIQYFCTTKMAWNDTTRFPYDTFLWQGIDGTSVLTHLNSLPQFIDSDEVVNLWNWGQHKDSEDKRLASYGWGDGGGGPTAEDMEKVRRLADLEGAPRTYYTRVSDFMKSLEETDRPWPRWVGELYLELHRGTLTAIAAIKRGNRKTELQLRDAEFTHVLAALKGYPYPKEQMLEVWKELLVNQFHDILPGTSISEANDVALASFDALMRQTRDLTQQGAARAIDSAQGMGTRFVVLNSLSWNRRDEIAIEGVPEGLVPANSAILSQRIEDLYGTKKLLVAGGEIPALGGTILELAKGTAPERKSPFRLKGTSLVTPHGTIKFDKQGRIRSYLLKELDRDAVAEGGAFNQFYLGEDVPYLWDQWDIDSDQELRMAPAGELVRREVVADGPLQFRIRSEYRIGAASTLRQDMILHALSPQITFETQVDWREKHQLLKVGFAVDVLATTARHEIQFGHVERPTHRNYVQDRARFEVACHKWSDLSDNGFGVALLNDCKYGIGVLGNEMRLSLLKSGSHPDPRHDHGTHVFSYAVLPHAGGFSVNSVVRPAYELNIPAIAAPAGMDSQPPASLLTVSAPSVIVESVKWAEDGKGVVVRLYEAGSMRTAAEVTAGFGFKRVEETNLLEEPKEVLEPRGGTIKLVFRAFEIKTLKFYL